MKLQDSPQRHLTYCLNVHPGETWSENLEAIRTKTVAVRNRVAPGGGFGLGLRLGRQAAAELSTEQELTAFRRFLASENMYVFTINGFPYGRFHSAAVKENVYKPDWRTDARLNYTLALSDILTRLLPAGVAGSISTLPCSYRDWIKDREDIKAVVIKLAEAALYLRRIKNDTGKEISLALEPEPDCFLGNTQDVIRFFKGPLLEMGSKHLSGSEEVEGRGNASEILKQHIGVCLDTAHSAVQFEDPAASLRKLAEAGIRISKVHISAGLSLHPTESALSRLRGFSEPVYLHQVKTMDREGRIRSFRDLGEALSKAAPSPGSCWRVHFHVPLFFENSEGLGSTSFLIGNEFLRTLERTGVKHLEIETYTFGVLPGPFRKHDITVSIAKEYEWFLNRCEEAGLGTGC